MIVLTLVVVGVAGYLHLDVDRFPSVDLPTVRVSTRLPGASPAEMESQVSQPIEEVLNTIEGIQELRSVNGSGSAFVVVTFDLNRDIDAAAQDVRDRVATVVRDLPRDTDPPTIAKSDTDQSPILSLALSGNRSQRELTEIADKIVKTQIERSAGVGRGRPRRRVWSAPSTCGWTPTGWPPIRFPSPRCATRWRARTPTFPAATSPAACASKPCARWGGCTDAQRLQRPGHRDAQRLAHPRAGHWLGGGRHQGAALHFPAQRRADGGAGGAAPIRRQHRGRHRRGEGEAARAGAAAARRREARGDPRPVALHLRGAARDQAAI